MPIHELSCQDCAHTFEILIFRPEELSEATCPSCNSRRLAKLMSAANFSMPAGSATTGSAGGCATESRTCQGGSCTSFTLPGHSR
ncbi:MAG: zinc ribbon domain-containing protein [Thermodesulfobacteriota bacterium]